MIRCIYLIAAAFFLPHTSWGSGEFIPEDSIDGFLRSIPDMEVEEPKSHGDHLLHLADTAGTYLEQAKLYHEAMVSFEEIKDTLREMAYYQNLKKIVETSGKSKRYLMLHEEEKNKQREDAIKARNFLRSHPETLGSRG